MDDDDDVEESDEGSSNEDEEGESSGSESFGEIDLGDDDEDEEVDLELRKKIEEALRVHGVKPATEDSDKEEEEELMDDEQMMAIDAQLAQVFSARANEKKGSKSALNLLYHLAYNANKTLDANAQREATHFKNRVLDLVDIFIKKQPTNPQIPRLIMPLIEVIAGAGQDELQLRDKAKGILRSRIGKAKEFPSTPNSDEVVAVLEALHIRARKSHTSDLLDLLGVSSVYVAKVLILADKSSIVEDDYRKSLEDFLTRKNSALNPQFFKLFFQRHPASAWKLRHDVLSLASKAVNAYRQIQALQLVEILINQMSNLVSHFSSIRIPL